MPGRPDRADRSVNPRQPGFPELKWKCELEHGAGSSIGRKSMPEDVSLHAWLIRESGPLAGARHPVQEPVTKIGRSLENDVIIGDAAMVSARHLEIRKDGNQYRLCDLNSTNGTYLNGVRVTEAILEPPCRIRLGADGPELTFLLDHASQANPNETLVAPMPPLVIESAPWPAPETGKPSDAVISHREEQFLAAAVARARMARRRGVGDQTVVIMREMLSAALNRTGKRFKIIISTLLVLLAAVSAYGIWKIDGLKKDKHQIDARIAQIESMLAVPGETPGEVDALVDQLDQYENQGRALKSKFLYKVSAFEKESPVEREIHVLMAEFGAETYSIPPEFVEQVNRFIERYQGPDRPHMERAEGKAREEMHTMRQIFEQQSLPPDLAYIVLVESAMSERGTSQAGAAGLWQFTPVTAKAYGLKVSREVDERLNAQKATRAACKYIRELILDFGAGSSVMLALAAYNLGPSRVKQAIRKVTDPIKQRNFWYLYRVRAVPPDTREYVPKVIAAMVIGRHPERFGF